MHGKSIQERRQQYARALRDLCRSRGVTPTGYALNLFLRREGQHIHAHTLTEHLNGLRLPRPATVEQILAGFKASADERALLMAFAQGATEPHIVSIRDALLPGADKGRMSQEAHWSYKIGRTDPEDVCKEERLTAVGTEGLRSVSLAIGQVGKLGFDLLDAQRLNLMVRAWRLSPESESYALATRQEVSASIQVVEFEPRASRYRLVVRFGELIRNERVQWSVGYRWPGLWRSLREDGVGNGSLWIDEESKVQTASVKLIAPKDDFPDLRLIPRSINRGTLKQRVEDEEVCIRWTVERPADPLRFEVRSDRHGMR